MDLSSKASRTRSRTIDLKADAPEGTLDPAQKRFDVFLIDTG